MKISTKGLLNWKPEAEGEREQMSKLYTDLLGIEDAINNNEFIIMGRKGAGKSAYAVYLQSLAKDPNHLSACKIVNSKDIQSERILNDVAQGKDKYTLLLEWLVLINLVRLIIENPEGTYHQNYKNLKSFYTHSSGHVDFTQTTTYETIWTREFNIKPLEDINIKAGRTKIEKGYKAPFIAMIESLRAAVCSTLSMDIFRKYQFNILIDDLDVGFSLKEDVSKQQLLALFRIVCKYNTDYLLNTNSKIIVFVRNDIANKLSNIDADSQKILDSYGYTINWYRGMEEGDNYLYSLINHRLEISFKERNISLRGENAWDIFAEGSLAQFKKLLDYTFYLPRDIINILKRSKDKNWNLPLKEYQIESLVKDYSDSKYNEICNELAAFYDSKEINDIKKALFKIAKDIQQNGALAYRQIMNHLENVSLSETHFQALVEHDILVPFKNNNLYYSYREKKLYGDYDEYEYNLPKVLYELFNKN